MSEDQKIQDIPSFKRTRSDVKNFKAVKQQRPPLQLDRVARCAAAAGQRWASGPTARKLRRRSSPGPGRRCGPKEEEEGFPRRSFGGTMDRRATLRAELDAIYAHLYGLDQEELDYIPETFPIEERKDVERYESCRTKEMVMERCDRYGWITVKTTTLGERFDGGLHP